MSEILEEMRQNIIFKKDIDVCKPSRENEVVRERDKFCLAAKERGYKAPIIAEFLGRDRTMVIKAIKRVEK